MNVLLSLHWLPFILTSHILSIICYGSFLCLTSFVFPRYFLASCVSYVVVFAHARMHVCMCMCVHARFLTWWPRGGRPSPAQTNSPLSLKAVNSVQTGQRKQAGPAGKEDMEGIREEIWIMWILLRKKISLTYVEIWYLLSHPVKVQHQVFTKNNFKTSHNDWVHTLIHVSVSCFHSWKETHWCRDLHLQFISISSLSSLNLVLLSTYLKRLINIF